MASRKSAVRVSVESKGVKQRLGRPVKDATEGLIMPLTKADITRAAKKRNGYEVDDPDNFSECALATCISKIAGAEVLIMRNHAFVALPGDKFTLRYRVDSRTTEIIHLNDEGRFDEIPVNTNLRLIPPTPKQRLSALRYAKNNKTHRQDTGRTVRTGRKLDDPYRGVWRNGNHATEEAA